jgi:hypothetical protein
MRVGGTSPPSSPAIYWNRQPISGSDTRVRVDWGQVPRTTTARGTCSHPIATSGGRPPNSYLQPVSGWSKCSLGRFASGYLDWEAPALVPRRSERGGAESVAGGGGMLLELGAIDARQPSARSLAKGVRRPEQARRP